MSKEDALPRERRKARMRRSGTKALGDEETETDLLEGAEKTEIDLQREEVTSGNSWVHPSPSCSHGTHLSSSPPLTTSVSQVLYEVQHEKFLRWPSQMRTVPAKRDITKYCDFHRDHGHWTDDCIQLKKEIEFLIRRGHLCRYVAPEDRNRAPPPPPRQLAPA